MFGWIKNFLSYRELVLELLNLGSTTYNLKTNWIPKVNWNRGWHSRWLVNVNHRIIILRNIKSYSLKHIKRNIGKFLIIINEKLCKLKLNSNRDPNHCINDIVLKENWFPPDDTGIKEGC